MIVDVALHFALELSGQGVWLCIRGRCTHRSHRIIGDTFLLALIAFTTVHLIG